MAAKKKTKPYARPRWDDMDNFTKKLEERRNTMLKEHSLMAARIGELRDQLSKTEQARNWNEARYELLIEEARCERDVATEKYVELDAWVNAQRKKKKGLRGPRPR